MKSGLELCHSDILTEQLTDSEWSFSWCSDSITASLTL